MLVEPHIYFKCIPYTKPCCESNSNHHLGLVHTSKHWSSLRLNEASDTASCPKDYQGVYWVKGRFRPIQSSMDTVDVISGENCGAAIHQARFMNWAGVLPLNPSIRRVELLKGPYQS